MTNRRDFIRITTLGAGALAVGGGLPGASRAFSKPAQGAELKVGLTRTATYCEVGFWKCAGWADEILPECTYLERYDAIRVSPHRKPALALRSPASKPLFDSKPGYWIARELSKKPH